MTRAANIGDFGRRLAESGLMVPSSVPGVWLRSATLERIVAALAELLHRTGDDRGATLLLAPPVLPREAFEHTGYLRSFPHLAGSVEAFAGADREHAELLSALEAQAQWTHLLSPTEVVLAPAACYPLYPRLTGTLSSSDERFEVESWCYRHEPSPEPTRLQSFRMREFVCVGTPGNALTHRDLWLDRALALLTGIGLPVHAEPANDPFFGRAGRILAESQRKSELKFEIVTPIGAPDAPVAIASANYHEDHFGRGFAISTPDGATAHSACFGLGLERAALALLYTHGLDIEEWPANVTARIWP